jgi:hypothetical protein
MFAAPLYLLTAVGLSSGSKPRTEHVTTVVVWGILWVIAVIAVRNISFRHDGSIDLRSHVYTGFPFLVTARELIRVAFAVKPQRSA